ncbi:LacI family DNA-binding transcriptional regulator [Halalkalibaculum sp. DA3122]|uniref:LacI family DNA-binding transcriptional regulator n=1 Tax=Halalkalibaculum sp. DA3122 TaxID=3373607 RepID=UPI003754B479
MSKNVSIKTIAKESGYSATTVSRVINGHTKKYRISDEAKEKILKIAKEYNYKANPVAVNLRLKKSYTIGLVIPSLDNPFFVNVTSLLNRELTKRGYNIILTESYDEPGTEKEMIMQLLERNVDGVLLIPSQGNTENVELLEETISSGVPILCIDRYIKNSKIPFITTDNQYGAYIGVKHLIENGHKKIACIQGLPDSTPSEDRKKGYLSALDEFDLEPFYIGGDEFSYMCGYRETQILLQKKDLPTAIFAMSSNIALGVMKAVEENGYSIPEDLSIVGFDNYEFLDHIKVPLTSIAQPIDEISHIAVKVLLDYVDGKMDDSDWENPSLKPSMILRDSVLDLTS